MAYKRFLIPLKGGRLLAERFGDGTIRLGLVLKQAARKPLDLWLFDDEKAWHCPKTLYGDRSGSINLRMVVRDTGLDAVRCACLTDSDRQAEAVGYCGGPLDWQSILQNSGKKPEEAPPEISAESFKEQVREMVEQLDSQLNGPVCLPQTAGLPDGLDWKKIDMDRLAGDKRLRRYARNPFVTEECKKYEHLLLAENDNFCFLGVPCAPEERCLGRSQGFRIFADCGGTNYCVLKCEK